MADFAKILIIIGMVIVFVGVLLLISIRFFPWLGNLPGDFRIERENFKAYLPLATMLIISLLATILLNVVVRIFRR